MEQLVDLALFIWAFV